MARAHFRDVLIGRTAAGALTLLSGASVSVRQTGTATPIAATLYAAATGVATLANPLTSGADGTVEFWLDADQRVDLAVDAAGYTPYTLTADVVDETTLTGTTLVNPTFSGAVTFLGAVLSGVTLQDSALAGSLTGTPVWASGQSFPGVTLPSGNLAFAGTSQRITGDMSNATAASRLLFAPTGVNASGNLGVLPNGTATTSSLRAYNAADPDNAGQVRLTVSGAAGTLAGGAGAGTGTAVTTLNFTGFSSGYVFDAQVSVPGGATPVLKTTSAITSGAAAATGTLTNAPAAGNPTKWIPISDNGTTRWIPAW